MPAGDGRPDGREPATVMEFEGGITRRGKVVLGTLCCLLLYAGSAPRQGVALCACGFGYWAFAYEDTVARQHADFQAAAKLLSEAKSQ